MAIYGKRSGVRKRRISSSERLPSGKPRHYVYYGSSPRTISRNLSTNLISWIQRRAETTRRKARVVDLGCGDGKGAETLAKTLKNEADVIGVDNFPVSKWESRRHARFVKGNFSFSLRYFPRRSLDLVYSHYGLYHSNFILLGDTPDSIIFLKKLTKKMRPGGMIVFNTPLHDPYLIRRYVEELTSHIEGCRITVESPRLSFVRVLRHLFGANDSTVIRIVVP